MIKLKITLAVLVTACLFIFSASAQLRIGIKGGGAVSSVLLSSRVQVDQAQASHADIQKPVYTYYSGFVLQFKAGNKFAIRTGAEYFKKAWEVEGNDRGRISTFRTLRKYDINYVQVPVNLLLTTPLATGRVYIGVGPYIACAVNGTVKVDSKIFDLEFRTFDEPIFTYEPGDNFKPIQFINHYTINRIDYGVNGLVGYEFGAGLYLEGGVNIGARQISTSYERYDVQWNRSIRDAGSSVKYSIVHLGLGWMINLRSRRSD